jgi:hypothetical protein
MWPWGTIWVEVTEFQGLCGQNQGGELPGNGVCRRGVVGRAGVVGEGGGREGGGRGREKEGGQGSSGRGGAMALGGMGGGSLSSGARLLGGGQGWTRGGFVPSSSRTVLSYILPLCLGPAPRASQAALLLMHALPQPPQTVPQTDRRSLPAV